jgi:hypothetical protein
VRYVNNLPVQSDEKCALAFCKNMSNLHFHGLHVSPKNQQDDVLTMMAMPGELLNYRVDVPLDAPPGLYWYHTHPHEESARQDLDGMSGAIVIEGIDRYYAELRDMLERVLILRDRVIEDGDVMAESVTFAVPQGGQNWFVLDCLPTAQSEAKNVSAGCTRKRRTDGDFRRFLPHPFVRQLPSYFATKPEMPSVRLFPSCSSPSPIVARHEFPTSRLLGVSEICVVPFHTCGPGITLGQNLATGDLQQCSSLLPGL